jgi:hypothetical protein
LAFQRAVLPKIKAILSAQTWNFNRIKHLDLFQGRKQTIFANFSGCSSLIEGSIGSPRRQKRLFWVSYTPPKFHIENCWNGAHLPGPAGTG